MIRKLSLCFWACWLWLWLSPDAAAQIAKYDLFFQRWSQFYAPFEDWHWFRAQGIAESGLNPAAVSYCGARGVMQLMPATARSLGVDPADPEQSIQGGIRYDRHLWDFWSIIASAGERRRFMFASYNAGPGSIRKAARLSNDKQRWATVSAALPCVTGAHAKETIRYINHIEEVFSRGAR